MATAEKEKFEERIEVVYTLIGDSTPRQARLVDLDPKTRADIDKLTILPIYNKNGKLSKANTSRIESFLTDFSALTVIAYPGQFQNINEKKLRADTRCPNLRVVCHYGHDDISSSGFKGTLNGTEVTSPDGSLGSFANVVGDTVKDGESSRPILREYRFSPKRTTARASTAKRTPINPIVTSDDVKNHTQTIIVAINELNVTIPDESQRFIADEEQVKNLLTLIRGMGVEEDILQGNVSGLISRVSGLKGTDTATIADNCGAYFEEFFDKVIEEAKNSQKQKLVDSGIESVREVTPGNFRDIAVTYLALEEVLTEDALDEKIAQLTDRKKKSLTEEKAQQLLDGLKAEIGDEEYANLSEEDKANRIKDKLETFIAEELPSKIKVKQIESEAVVELNREAMETLKTFRRAMDRELSDEDKKRADRWITSLGEENLYSLVESLNTKKISQEEFEEVLTPFISNESVRGLFISAIMAKCNGVVTQEMLEEIKYILAGLPENASEEEILDSIDESMITLEEIEKILNESPAFNGFVSAIDGLQNDEDKKYARGVEKVLPLELLDIVKQQLRETQGDNFTKEDLLQAFGEYVKAPEFAEVIQRVAEDCRMNNAEETATSAEDEETINSTEETLENNDESQEEQTTDPIFTVDDVRGCLDGDEAGDYSKLWNAFRTMERSNPKRKEIRPDVLGVPQWILDTCQGELDSKSFEDKMGFVMGFIANDPRFKDHIAEIASRGGLTLQEKEETILVNIDDVNDLLIEYDPYTDALQQIMLQPDGDKKSQAQATLNEIPAWIFNECKDKLSTRDTFEDQIDVIKEFISKDESFKVKLNDILNTLNVHKDEIREVIVKEMLKTPEYSAIIDYINSMPTGKSKKDVVRDSCEIPKWVLSECKKKLGLTSEDPTQEQIAQFVAGDEFKNYIIQFAKDHGIELTVEEEHHEEELPAWQKDISTNMKFIATLAQLREDLKDDNEKYNRLAAELTKYVIETTISEIGSITDEGAQLSIVRNVINREDFNKKVEEIYTRENIVVSETEEETEEEEVKDKIADLIETICQYDDNYQFFMGEVAKLSDESMRAVAIAKINYYVDKMVRKVEDISNDSTDKEITDAIRLVLSSEGFNKKCRDLTSEESSEEFKVLETITTNVNYMDFISTVRSRLSDEDTAVKIGSHLIQFVVEHCERQVDDERDLAKKAEIVNNFINGARFRGEISKIYQRYEIENSSRPSGEGSNPADNIFVGFSNDAFGRVLNSTDEYRNFVNAINELEIEESIKLAIISDAVKFIKDNCQEEVNNASTEIKKIGCIKSFLRSQAFAEKVRDLIEKNTPAPVFVARPANGVEIEEPDVDRNRTVTRGPEVDPINAIDDESIRDALRRFVASYEERLREVGVSGGGENSSSIIPLLAGAENIKIGTVNIFHNEGEMGDVITPAQIDSDGAEFSLANRVDGARNIASSSSAIADAGADATTPNVEDMFGITPTTGDTAPAPTTGDPAVATPTPNTNNGATANPVGATPTATPVGATAGSTPATTPVSTGSPAGSTTTPTGTPTSTTGDARTATATTPTGASASVSAGAGKPTSAGNGTTTTPSGKGTPTTPDKKGSTPSTTTPSGKTTPSDPGKKGVIPDDGKKPTPEKKDIPKVRLLEFGEKTLDVINEPKKPWYKRLAKWVVRHPIATTAICLGAGALVAAGIGVIAAGGVVPAITALNFSLPKVAAISGAVGLGAGGIIGGGLLIGTNISKTGKKERLYKKFEKKYKKCQAIQESIAEYQETINANKEKQQQLEERHRSGKGILKSLGVYKRARKKVRKQNRKLTQKMRQAEETYAETVSEAIDKKNELNAVEEMTGSSLALGGYFDKKRKVEEDFRSGKIDKEDYDFEMEDLEEEVPGITKTSSRVKTFDGEVSELISRVKKEHATKRMTDTMGEIKKRYTKLEPEVYEAPDLGSDIVKEIAKKKAKEEMESTGGTFVESDFSTSYEAMKKKQKGKVDAYREFERHNPEAFKKANEEYEKRVAGEKEKTDEPSK